MHVDAFMAMLLGTLKCMSELEEKKKLTGSEEKDQGRWKKRDMALSGSWEDHHKDNSIKVNR